MRELDCFELKLENLNSSRLVSGMIEIQPIDRNDLHWYVDFLDWQPSWENSFASIGQIPNTLAPSSGVILIEKGHALPIIRHDPDAGCIAQCND